MIDQDDPLAELLDILHVVTGQECDDLVTAVVFPEEFPDLFLAHDIETDRRLIQEENLGTVHQRGDQLHLHPLTQTQFPDHDAHLVADIKQLRELPDGGFKFRSSDSVDRPVQFK